jgi:ABC-type polysaccharide/polyol phosphate transport system ATPase subunit
MGTPVKNFSSGMYARLAFAIAAHAEPDVLLVDEVLAVGDTAFQLKCFDWIGAQRKQGLTIIMVTHNVYSISDADRCMYLDGGRVREIGPPQEVLDTYARSQQAPEKRT